jgi:hypothetical protein
MLAALLPVLAPILDRVLGAVLPDPQARAKAVADIYGQLQSADLAQMEVNKTEAQSESLLARTWRPAIGWACATALWFQFVVSPIAVWVGFWIGKPIPKPVELDAVLWELMFGMLGMGALRSFEKIKSASR